jgi:membrane-bound inhibitor of C-type lysozyme
MKRPVTGAATIALAAALPLLSACAGISLSSPFGGVKEQDVSRAPAGAMTYQCEGGKRFFVRYLDSGAAAWVILPEREFRLNQTVSASGARYSNGNSTLETKGNEATLWDGATVTHVGCKAATG